MVIKVGIEWMHILFITCSSVSLAKFATVAPLAKCYDDPEGGVLKVPQASITYLYLSEADLVRR